MLIGNTNEEKIYNFFVEKGFTISGTCGILGNLHAESACIPFNLQNTGNKKLSITDEEYTEQIDAGIRNFEDGIGYGLAQWTHYLRKRNLLNYANQYKKSIGDLEMQLNYLIKELKQYGIYDDLRKSVDMENATRIFLTKFEKPASVIGKTEKQIKNIVDIRTSYAKTIFDRYCEPIDLDLEYLESIGVMNTKEYWKNVSCSVKYFDVLMHNVAEKIRGK